MWSYQCPRYFGTNSPLFLIWGRDLGTELGKHASCKVMAQNVNTEIILDTFQQHMWGSLLPQHEETPKGPCTYVQTPCHNIRWQKHGARVILVTQRGLVRLTCYHGIIWCSMESFLFIFVQLEDKAGGEVPASVYFLSTDDVCKHARTCL